VLTIEARTPSDIRNWQVCDGETEDVRPIPKLPKKPKPEPAPAVAVSAPDPFLSAFHAAARGALDEATFQALEELVRGC
jgi:hypothetical protein